MHQKKPRDTHIDTMAARKKITLPELPPEILLFQILPRLPAKSLLRFKCVCKQWRSFLTTSIFTKMQLHYATTVDHHEKLILFIPGSTSRCKFLTIDCEDGLIAPPRYCPFPGNTAATKITSSVNGLVCVGVWNNAKALSDIILWNPLTDEYKTLPIPVDRKCYNIPFLVHELCYTCTDDDYKILRINVHGNVYIYSLKSDSWRKLESKLDHPDSIPYAGDHHNLLDENLHFLVNHRTRNLIIRLDLKTERFTKIAVPSTCRDGLLRLMVVKGCIHLTVFKEDFSSRTWTIEEWRMDGDGSWTKVVNSICSIQDLSFLGPLYLMRNGNWLMCTKNDICKVDPKKNTKDHLSSSTPLAIYQIGIYIETFVSPNQYTH
ncbi:hypothetical protein OSB04_009511 [Centaurea solstitialis]|uniref:F-box domain-containing protein n=1 Tax=Centaurea solstitialis TaxID=347529 RepID=A0AA38WBZ9_9ASTR|nr:hypothetical protein OSB04_009511 [Centaurea solstitialis]